MKTQVRPLLSVIQAHAIENTLMDDAGRPLAEILCPEKNRIDVPMEYITCPFEGSRNGKPMNISALKGITANWNEAMAMISEVRALYLQSVNRQSPTILDLWRISAALVNMPLFLHLHGPCAHQPIPALAATVYKLALGPFNTFKAVCLSREILEGSQLDSVVDSETVYDLVESEGHLLMDSRACAGPPRKIQDFLDLLVDGKTKTKLPNGVLSSLVPDFGSLLWLTSVRQRINELAGTVDLRSAELLSEWKLKLPSLASNLPEALRANFERGLERSSASKTSPDSAAQDRSKRKMTYARQDIWFQGSRDPQFWTSLSAMLDAGRKEPDGDLFKALEAHPCLRGKATLISAIRECLSGWEAVEQQASRLLVLIQESFTEEASTDGKGSERTQDMVAVLFRRNPRTYFESALGIGIPADASPTPTSVKRVA